MAISNELKNKLQAGIGYPENVSYLGNKPNFTRDTFDTLADMRAAAEEGYIDEGHLSYCKEDGKHYKYAKTGENTFEWIVFKPGGTNEGAFGIYTQESYEALDERDKPDEFICVDDYENEISSTETLNILFSAIRALQAEVTRLKNSFQLGINSATGNETTASRIIATLDDVEEEEPLWAVQESELSSIFSLQFSTETELKKSDETTRIEVGPGGTYLNIIGDAYWDPSDSGSSSVDIPNLPDAKTFLYLTTSKKTVVIKFTGEDGETYPVSLNDLLEDSISSNTYATLIAVSKKITDPISNEKYGESFIWITVQDLINNNTIFERYINPVTLQLYGGSVGLSQNYYISKIELSTLKLSKFDLYSKYQDFSDHVEAVRPSDLEDIKYKAAHITIRSVDTVAQLDKLIKKLQENELVYVIENNSLYIINDNSKHKIGSGGVDPEQTTDDTMTVQELISNLASQGIIILNDAEYDDDGNLTQVNDVELAKLSSLSFINENTGSEITYSVDSEGNLQGYIETPENLKFSYIVTDRNKTNTVIGTVDGNLTSLDIDGTSANRGFIARIHGDNVAGSSKDQGLKSDRVKIGSFYAPLNNATLWGCSHAYVELENTSNTDYYLDGCYLHFAGPILGKAKDGSGDIKAFQASYHLPLRGKLPAGGTYLIRGHKYTDPSLPTTYIDVNTFDIEWYVKEKTNVNSVSGKVINSDQHTVTIYEEDQNYDYSENFGKLIKFDYVSDALNYSNITYGFALTYGQPNLSPDTVIAEMDINSGKILLQSYLLDSLNMFIGNDKTKSKWNSLNSSGKLNIVGSCPGNAIIKNTFELDPAKQAFQSYSDKDSSRLRGVTAADNQIIELDNEYIQFPNSNDTYPVSKFTPKASFEYKNVSTDKTSLNSDKPNMVTVSFGINQTTTRCFNWISVGYYDEYVWIRKQGQTEWSRIQSYWGSNNDSSGEFSRKSFDEEITYSDSYGNHTTIREVVYADPKYKNTFPGCNIQYTSHKCIINLSNSNPSSPEIYEYLVGRSNSDGTPMEGHTSDVQTFTKYPSSYTPVIYQITDQQGFHWIEYQAWAAAAKVINQKIEDETWNHDGSGNRTTAKGIIPILLNTGDMTQNGTRINEWLDYYNAGYCLFDHLEQMNLVGNNDLGNSNETKLGTGDDPGKSNPHFYNICYCYEIPVVTDNNKTYTPIYCGTKGPKYIPSMYYFDAGTDYRIFIGNSEITGTAGYEVFNCQNYYENGNGKVDIYTGYTWNDENNANTSDATTRYIDPLPMKIEDVNASFYIYEILYKWLAGSTGKKVIFACHEMPFTVVTQDNLKLSTQYADRSISVEGSSTGLVGSHCNRNQYNKSSSAALSSEFKIRNKGTYWLSRLLENFEVRYCIGGHKHTYACTWPLREYYYYKSSGGTIYNSLDNGPMAMPESLKDDVVYFTINGSSPVVAEVGSDMVGESNLTSYRNLTKFPLINTSNFNNHIIKGNYSGTPDEYIVSATEDTYTFTSGGQTKHAPYVVYFMLQATGFKLKSNKELPGTLQKFSQIIPQTNGTKPNTSQIYPMFAKIILNSSNYDSNNGLEFQLMAINNIVPNDTTLVFNQQTVKDIIGPPSINFFSNTGDDSLNVPYGKSSSSSKYGDLCWTGTSSSILNLHL